MPRNWVLLATGGSKRVRLLQAARAQLGLPPALLLEWRDWLLQPAMLAQQFQALGEGTVFKIEPPGDDSAAHWHLLQLGCRQLDLSPLPAPLHGQLLAQQVWFAGFTAVMQKLARQLVDWPQVWVVNHPHEIVLMTDKLACQQHLQGHQVPTPPLYGAIKGYDELRALMAGQGLQRVFVKARYGSSASGVLAYRRTADGREQVITSTQMVDGNKGPLLFNTKRLQRYHEPQRIATLIDLICQQHAYLEGWVDKPRSGNGHFDVRVLTLAGKAAHRVARAGAFAMTNLHLDNRREEVTGLLAPARLQAMQLVAEKAARAFPASGVIGLDLVPQRDSTLVLEANAFGDLLPGLLWQGQDSYGAQTMLLPALAAEDARREAA